MPISKVSQAGLSSGAQFNGFKNRIINGAMSVWQRATSFTNPTTTNFYTADRWGVNRAGDVAGATVSRSTSAPAGFQYSLDLQRTAGNSSTAGLYLFYSSESSYTYDLAGQTVTVSFWAKAGANYSGGTLNFNAYGGTGTDQRIYAYTGSTTLSSYAPSITSNWTLYSTSFSVPSNITEMGIQFSWFPTGTAGADDAVYITGIQLEKGSTATSFDYRDYGRELALCQRYFISTRTSSQNGMLLVTGEAVTTSRIVFSGVQFPVVMRSAPTTTVYSSSADTSGAVALYNAISSAVGSGFTVSTSNVQGFYNRVDGSTSLTAGSFYSFSYEASAEL